MLLVDHLKTIFNDHFSGFLISPSTSDPLKIDNLYTQVNIFLGGKMWG
jgi:hypothetical protein